MECPNCGEQAPTDAKWCEACGQDLNSEPLPTCVACGEREVAEEGYCLSCGHKQPEERDHMVFEAGPAVAVTDRGKRHRHNEDAVAIGSIPGGATVLVVCDGVSTTAGSAEASLRAATAARDLLVSGLDGTSSGVASSGTSAGTSSGVASSVPQDSGVADPQRPDPNTADGDVRDPNSADGEVLDTSTLLAKAVEVAQAEASASADIAVDSAADPAVGSHGGPPSSTFVAVIVQPTADGAELTTAWVGDSRAYWIGEDARRLSPVDHEIAGSLVRWLGADSVDPTPDIELTTVSGTGHVVVCSDGLWRYAQEPGELNELVDRLTDDGAHGLALASAMVDFANEGGGHDNISVALWTNTESPTAGSTGQPPVGQAGSDPEPGSETQ